MIVQSFIGPSNVLRSTNQDVERSVNCYLERSAPGTGKFGEASLDKRPGLRELVTVGDSPWRQTFFENGRCFGVAGSTFYELDENWVATGYGDVAATSNHVTIVSNGTAGNQLLIDTGHNGYVFDLGTNSLTRINNANYPGTGFPDGDALCCEFMDGYGIVLWRDSRKFSISGLEDFTSWDALDVAERSEGSDNIQTLVRNHRELWMLGSQTGEVWYDNGDPLFPFAPVPGVFLPFGAAGGTASSGVVMSRFGTTVAWIGQSQFGGGTIQLANGYDPVRISTHAVERDIQTLDDPTYGFLFAHQQDGHEFLWCLFPELKTTWIYDKTTDRWFEWARWNPITCEFEPHTAGCYAFAFQQHIVGARDSGVLYEMTFDALDDGAV